MSGSGMNEKTQEAIGFIGKFSDAVQDVAGLVEPIIETGTAFVQAGSKIAEGAGKIIAGGSALLGDDPKAKESAGGNITSGLKDIVGALPDLAKAGHGASKITGDLLTDERMNDLNGAMHMVDDATGSHVGDKIDMATNAAKTGGEAARVTGELGDSVKGVAGGVKDIKSAVSQTTGSVTKDGEGNRHVDTDKLNKGVQQGADATAKTTEGASKIFEKVGDLFSMATGGKDADKVDAPSLTPSDSGKAQSQER